MWTQSQLAEAVGVTWNTIARWERGEIPIRESMARLIRLVAGGAIIETPTHSGSGRTVTAHKPPKGAGPRHSKSTNRQKSNVQGKRRGGVR